MYSGCGGGGRGGKCDGRDADQMWHREGEKRESVEWDEEGRVWRGEMGVRRGGNMRRAWRGEKRWERKDGREEGEGKNESLAVHATVLFTYSPPPTHTHTHTRHSCCYLTMTKWN